MKKYILITALILSNTTLPMNHKQHPTKPVANDPEALILSFQENITNKKAGLVILDTINENTGIRPPKVNNHSDSPLFFHTYDSKL